MSATREGGLKAAATNKAKYGKDWYKKLGHMGGKAGGGSPPGQFAYGKVDPRTAGLKGGAIGGRRSKRGKAKVK